MRDTSSTAVSLKSSSGAELRVFLTKQRETVAMHMMRAQSILESMR